MTTVLLPGYSSKNKGWAESIKSQLAPKLTIEIIYWNHWTQDPDPNWITQELEKIKTVIGTTRVNILAKSIGTLIAMQILQLLPTQINKVILCGVPINDLNPGDTDYYQALKSVAASNVLCIQNAADSHGNYEQVKDLLASINPDFRIINKPRSDHEYPYPDDFKSFLT